LPCLSLGDNAFEGSQSSGERLVAGALLLKGLGDIGRSGLWEVLPRSYGYGQQGGPFSGCSHALGYRQFRTHYRIPALGRGTPLSHGYFSADPATAINYP
jgi:hypothetical protein